MLFYSVLVNSIGLFIEPLTNEYGWRRTEIMAGYSLLSVSAIFLSPLIGALIDRFGSRRIALSGIVLTAFAIASYGIANGSFVQWLIMWGFTSLALLLSKTTVWTTAISGTFTAGRSLALAVTICGTAVAQAIVPPLTQWLISGFGRCNAYFALGLG